MSCPASERGGFSLKCFLLTLFLVCVCGGGATRPPPVVVFALDGKPLNLGVRNLVTFPNYLLGTLRQNFEFLACAEASPEPVSWG